MKMRPTINWQDDVWVVDLAKRELRSVSDTTKIVKVDTLIQGLLDDLEASIEERTEEYSELLEMVYQCGDALVVVEPPTPKQKEHQPKGW